MSISLRTILENLDDIPDNMHELYTEKDGKFILNLEGVDEHPAVTALKNALERQKQANRKINDDFKAAKEKLAKIPEDFDPDEFLRIKTTLEEYEANPDKRKDGDAKAAQEAVAARKMLEQKMANMEKANTDAINKFKKQLEVKDGFISQLLIDEGLTKALVEVGVGKEFLKAAKALLREDVKVVDEDGSYKAIVETDTGPLDISRYVSDWVASDEGKVFIPPAKGSDAGPGKTGPKLNLGEKNPWAKETWNLTLQGKMLREDRMKADKLAKAAGQAISSSV